MVSVRERVVVVIFVFVDNVGLLMVLDKVVRKLFPPFFILKRYDPEGPYTKFKKFRDNIIIILADIHCMCVQETKFR